MGRTMYDFIQASISAEQQGGITYEEWCEIRRSGDPDAIAEAVERMEAAGGYDNLQ